MQIYHLSAYLGMWLYVLLGAMTSAHPGTSNAEWRRSSKHARHATQENDVIKSDSRKKVLHKSSTTSNLSSKTKQAAANSNVKGAQTSETLNGDLRLTWFLRTDRNADGFVSAREYAKSQAMSMREAKMVVRSFDQNNDNFVSRAEYLLATANAVGKYQYKKKYEQNKACSVELLNGCAVSLVKSVLKGKGLVRCSKLTAFAKCISKHSRKCDSETRKNLQSQVKTISKTLQPKGHCDSKQIKAIFRSHRSRNQRKTGQTPFRPTSVIACSKELIKNLVSSERSCDNVQQYKTCLKLSYRQFPRPIKRRLRQSVRTVTKVCRRVREYA